jgi:demethylmenaquinone methyltransferase/2-methoxy-6-polyprenyl-1,4-benzoquinol methylase
MNLLPLMPFLSCAFANFFRNYVKTPAENHSISRVSRTRSEARGAYDRLSRWYDALAGNWEQKPRLAGLQLLAVQPGEIVLEIGPGTGQALSILALAASEHGRVLGLDLSPGMLAIAGARLAQTALAGQVGLSCGDAACLPFARETCDALFTSFTLELFDTPEIPLVLQECRRVLRPGGRLCVISLSKAGPSRKMVGLYEWSHARFPALVDCRPIFARQSLEDAGFRIVEARQMSLWGLPVEIVLGCK